MRSPDGDRFTEPFDAVDPRFVEELDEVPPERPRRLVRSDGPGPNPDVPAVRILRIALPLVFLAGVGAIVAVFFSGLSPGPQSQVVGAEAAVRAGVVERPRRICFNDNNPCAWLTVVDERLVAFNTSGPLPQEYGRQGVGWCASSQRFGANSTGSRYDRSGQVAAGPSNRGLDRFTLSIRDGDVVVDFSTLTAGPPAFTADPEPAAGPDCDRIPFDRAADLRLGE